MNLLRRNFFVLMSGCCLLLCAAQMRGAAQMRIIKVDSTAQLRVALREARPGTRVEIAPGEYAGGLYIEGPRGEAGKPIVIAGADAKNPPVFSGGNVGLHLADPRWIEIEDIIVEDSRDNGISIDDGGDYDASAQHITLRRVQVRDIGPQGNHDGIKLSGVTDFTIESSTLEHWGIVSGCGIDMVGCHRGLIQNNTFRHNKDAQNTGASAIQNKGGTRDITIRRNRFEHAGQRAINIGGSTGLQFFRPSLRKWWPNEAPFEAKNIRVEGNTFIGGGTPMAFVGVDGAIVRFNTIYHPQRWALRILQETTAPNFVSSRNGVFEDNLVVFRTDQWFEGGVNIGPNTQPKTFRFARNWWFASDNPARSRPQLPSAEVAGIYGEDPQLRDQSTLDVRVKPESAAIKVGAEALPDEERAQK
jgi:hypothetical protein